MLRARHTSESNPEGSYSGHPPRQQKFGFRLRNELELVDFWGLNDPSYRKTDWSGPFRHHKSTISGPEAPLCNLELDLFLATSRIAEEASEPEGSGSRPCAQCEALTRSSRDAARKCVTLCYTIVLPGQKSGFRPGGIIA